MELRQLRYFVAVAEELHFGRAAARVHIAQPPLSQAIRALEEDLGAQLFARTSRSVALTQAGAVFLAEARAILAQVAGAAQSARRIHDGESGQLAVGYMNPAMDAVLCRALAAFRQERPEVDLRLRELPSPAQLEELRAGRLDLAFVRLTGRLAGQDLRGLEAVTVVREPYVLALPTGHPLARLRVVPLSEAGKFPLLLFPRSQMPELYDAVLAGFRACGAEPQVAQEVQGKHAALALVAAGLGLCLVPASAREWRRRGVVLRPVAGDLPVVEMGAAWRQGHGCAAGRRLVELALECGLGGG